MTETHASTAHMASPRLFTSCEKQLVGHDIDTWIHTCLTTPCKPHRWISWVVWQVRIRTSQCGPFKLQVLWHGYLIFIGGTSLTPNFIGWKWWLSMIAQAHKPSKEGYWIFSLVENTIQRSSGYTKITEKKLLMDDSVISKVQNSLMLIFTYSSILTV